MNQLRAVATAAAVAAALLCAAGAAQAQTSSNPYYIGASQTFTNDSNLLRVSEGAAVPAGYSQSDRVSSTALLAGLDQYFGRQHAYGTLAVRANRYSNNSFLNNQSYNASGGLDLSTINRISGSITASASRSLQRFTSEEVGFLTDKNLLSTAAVNARASIGMVTRYSLDLNAGWQRSKNSLQTASIVSRDFSETSAGFALQWRPSSATTLGLGASRNQGRYPRFRTAANGDYTADRYERTTLDFNAQLRFSGISSFEARISSGKTSYDLNSARDFSGLTGTVAWAYQPTGKLQFNASFSRDTGQDSYATTVSSQATTADYGRVSNNWRLQSNYQLTGKIALTASAALYDRRVVQTIDTALVPLSADGHDKTTVFTLGGRWQALRNVSAGCDFSNESRRATGQLVANLKDRIFGCFGQITLQ